MLASKFLIALGVQRAVQSASEVTGGSLDYIIANGAYTSDASNWASVEKL